MAVSVNLCVNFVQEDASKDSLKNLQSFYITSDASRRNPPHRPIFFPFFVFQLIYLPILAKSWVILCVNFAEEDRSEVFLETLQRSFKV